MAEHPNDDFRTRWRALEASKRKQLARLANAGETSDRADEAALVAGYARRRLRPLEMVGSFLGALLGYVAIAAVLLDGPEPAILFGLAVGVAAFLIFQRRRLATALDRSREVLGLPGDDPASG